MTAFSSHQREALIQCGLSDAEVSALEVVAEQLRAASLAESAVKMADIRDPLLALRDATRAVRARLAALTDAQSRPARRAGAHLLGQAKTKEDAADILDAPRVLDALERMSDAAIATLPGQTRPRADPYPVQMIWAALVAANAPTPMTLRPSSSPGSRFRRICGTLYEALKGTGYADPERAIKEFIAERAAQRRAAENRSRPHARTRVKGEIERDPVVARDLGTRGRRRK